LVCAIGYLSLMSMNPYAPLVNSMEDYLFIEMRINFMAGEADKHSLQLA